MRTVTPSLLLPLADENESELQRFLHLVSNADGVLLIAERATAHYLPTLASELRQVFPTARLLTLTHYESGEDLKTFPGLMWLLGEMSNLPLNRNSVLMSVGGGACSDLVGLAAGLFHRGLDWVSVPTTVLAMVDAALGGKTAINLPSGKNLVGMFHEPRHILYCPNTLKTLPDLHWKSGMGEVIKTCLLSSGRWFSRLEYLLNHEQMGQDSLMDLYIHCLKFKADIVARDPRDKGIRQCLNLGHTAGHALEHIYDYKYPHGICVLHGIVIEMMLANALFQTGPLLEARVMALIHRLNLSLPSVDATTMLKVMARDKKSGSDSAGFVFLRDVGELMDPVNLVQRVSLQALATRLPEILNIWQSSQPGLSA